MATTDPKSPSRLASTPPEAWEPLRRAARLARRPLDRFLRIEASSGILLLVAAGVALAWANSPWRESYFDLWHTPLGVRLGGFFFERSLEWVVNDGLMVIFFFVVGLEIRREIYCGELSEWRRAALPAAAAFGGMLAPALVYLVIAGAPVSRAGWGVPMATDIAFAVGVLALLGSRVPPALRVLLLALAVIDDLGAIVVIAVFYSSGIAWSGLLVAGLALIGIVAMQRFGVRSKIGYVAPALVVWGGVYASGIHPTIAGVVVGLMTPVRAWLGPEGFVEGTNQALHELAGRDLNDVSRREIGHALGHLDAVRREALSPAEGLIEALHPWVAFAIMPVFALANAGVVISTAALEGTSWRVALAVGAGLLLGKPVGVVAASVLALRARVATLPRGLTLRHLILLGVVAGVGFTMALFVAQLAFVDAELLAAAKIGVLAGSALAAVVVGLLGRALLSAAPAEGAALTADEAESSTEV